VEIANPAQFADRADTDPPLVTLFVYRLEPDHTALLATPNSGAAIRMHTLISVTCTQPDLPNESIGSQELRILSHIMRLFHENHLIGPVRIQNALPIGPIASMITSDFFVEARQMAPDMEEINHIWTTQGDTPYKTSLVYRFSFGIITPSSPKDEGPPVLRVNLEDTDNVDPNKPDVTPQLTTVPSEPQVDFGVLAQNAGSIADPQLLPNATVIAAAGSVALDLVGVTENAETLDLILESFDAINGVWADAGVILNLSNNSITTLAREILQGGGAVSNLAITFDNPNTPTVLRLLAFRTVGPETLSMAPIVITIEAAP
jgi:hypothetical protein